MKHLQQLAPDMFAMLEHADDLMLRRACLCACEYAASHNKLHEPLVERALDALRVGRQYREDETAQLRALVSLLDDRYFELKDLVEEQEDEPTRETLTRQYREYFQKARSVAAFLSAADEDSFEAATEAIYEAAASTPNGAVLFDRIKQVLTS